MQRYHLYSCQPSRAHEFQTSNACSRLVTTTDWVVTFTILVRVEQHNVGDEDVDHQGQGTRDADPKRDHIDSAHLLAHHRVAGDRPLAPLRVHELLIRPAAALLALLVRGCKVDVLSLRKQRLVRVDEKLLPREVADERERQVRDDKRSGSDQNGAGRLEVEKCERVREEGDAEKDDRRVAEVTVDPRGNTQKAFLLGQGRKVIINKNGGTERESHADHGRDFVPDVQRAVVPAAFHLSL